MRQTKLKIIKYYFLIYMLLGNKWPKPKWQKLKILMYLKQILGQKIARITQVNKFTF